MKSKNADSPDGDADEDDSNIFFQKGGARFEKIDTVVGRSFHQTPPEKD
ncbi:hypothetical protein [Desulfogranum mediterraneum]|nr:hypothetical protein [Desulfogranum mediterraneum]